MVIGGVLSIAGIWVRAGIVLKVASSLEVSFMKQEIYEFLCRTTCIDSKDRPINHKEVTITVTGYHLEQARFKAENVVVNKFSKGRVQAKNKA